MNKNKMLTVFLDFFKKADKPQTRKYFRISYHVIWNIILLFLIFGVIGAAFAGGVGAGYFASLVKDEDVRSKESLTKDIYDLEETSEIYFADNVYLGKINTDLEREIIPIEEISPHLINAVVATEDEYFYEHAGIVPKAIFRALFQEVANTSVQSGGSTLTQQLVKQQVLTNELSFERKAKEIILAMRVEKYFQKDEILEAYLNVSPFGRNSSGRNIAGAQAAAQGIFGVNAKDLNLAQASYIAGLPKSPFGYTPFTNKGEVKSNLEPGLNRQKTVLSSMLSAGFITEAEYKDALAYDITKDFIPKQDPAFAQYPYLTTEVEERTIELLVPYFAEKDGYSQKDLDKSEDLTNHYYAVAKKAMRQNGYKIHTTINKDMYVKMQQVAADYKHYGRDLPETVTNKETKQEELVIEPVELGAVLMENATGKILSFVGGRDFNRKQVNHATYTTRPNGSTMKPILVYAPGIELGALAPGTLVLDAPISVPTPQGAYRPTNYASGSYKGLTTAREALVRSDNVPAVKFYMDIINQNPVQYLAKMGFTSLTEGDYSNYSMSIGGLTDGVTVEENVNAYATLANNGQFVDAYMIEKIETKKGEVIYQHEIKPDTVFSPQTAYLTIDMMRDVLSRGTATAARNRLNFSSDFAGKTGTSQSFYDAWFVASNPTITFGVWNGYDTPKSLSYSYNGLSYSQRNQYLWADLLNAAYTVNPELIGPKKRFTMPNGIIKTSFCALLKLSGDICSTAGISGTDLFPVKYAVSFSGQATSTATFVTIGDSKYKALPTTPAEFVDTGSVMSENFLRLIAGKYVSTSGLSGNFKGAAVGGIKTMNENGAVPYPLSIQANGNTITWSKHGDSDIIGYRVYKNGQQVSTIRNSNASFSFTGDVGEYTVRAVDIAGNESASSNIIILGQVANPAPEETQPPPETTIPEEENTPPPDSGAGNGSGDDNSENSQ
ncbi:penicillin-binding protein [Bacillus sp. AGMB 02131]|uniref:Penicillin-binding protein n=1 Tax=Peribacillus faecalis TaxID=2772559 RepID=A0A927D1G6_9BACI|nr:transglycosylase domain-containing protein [Peribacillus faecalis]MBD3110487.1 penicillin-binding protein [Peribacillus faecalis]